MRLLSDPSALTHGHQPTAAAQPLASRCNATRVRSLALAAALLSASTTSAFGQAPAAPQTPATAVPQGETAPRADRAATGQADAASGEAAERAALYGRIRSAWYHPGKIGLACDATLDFSQVLAKIGEAESAKELDGLKLRVTASDSRYADVTFTWPASVPPESRTQVEAGARQVIGGFFQAYWPLANGEILPPLTGQLTILGAVGGGYTIAQGNPDAPSTRLTVESNGLIRRVENRAVPGQPSILTLAFTPSAQPRPGDIAHFTGLNVDRTAAGNRIQAMMSWDEQSVSGIFVPHRVSVGVPGGFTIPFTLTACTVTPDPGPKPR